MAEGRRWFAGAEAEAEAAEQTARRGDANNLWQKLFGGGLENWRSVWHVKEKTRGKKELGEGINMDIRGIFLRW